MVENRLLGFDRSKAPLVLVFTGPSGVGKTQLASHLASILHGAADDESSSSHREECFVQLQMNQYQDERSIDTLIGPPVGVVGEGQLTGALRKCPSAVVLLDEFEKAHPRAIPDVFLGAFDAGAKLVDTKTGIAVPTNKATFILTSNFGADIILAEQADLVDADQPAVQAAAQKRVRAAVESAMAAGSTQSNPFARSEFRGRLRATAIFTPFSKLEQREVAMRALGDLARHYYNAEGQHFRLGWRTPSVPDYFAHFYGGPDGKQGLRPMLDSIDSCDSLLLQAKRSGKLKSGGGALFVTSANGAKIELLFPNSDSQLFDSQLPRLDSALSHSQLASDSTSETPPAPPVPAPDSSSSSSLHPLPAMQSVGLTMDSEQQISVDKETERLTFDMTAKEKQMADELAVERNRADMLERKVEALEEELRYYKDLILYMSVAAVVAVVASAVIALVVAKALIWWTLVWLVAAVLGLLALAYYFPFVAQILRWVGGLIWQYPRTAAALVFLVWLWLMLRGRKSATDLRKRVRELEKMLETLQKENAELAASANTRPEKSQGVAKAEIATDVTSTGTEDEKTSKVKIV
eukprot:SAG31_NODE_3061_length_4730_cov_16.996330_1_plen_580_part_00